REYPNGFAGLDAAVIEIPQFRPLVLGIPLAVAVAERIDAFLGTGFFLIAPGAAEGCVEPALAEGVQQGGGLQKLAAAGGAQTKWLGTLVDGCAIGVDDQAGPDFAHVPV